MRIERIDEKTVKCYLSSEELEEYDISYKDFVTRSPKAREMVEQIIAQAVEEVGYKPPEFAMDMQIMMMPDQGMILTLSEKTPEDLKNDPKLADYLNELKKLFAQHGLAQFASPEQLAVAKTPEIPAASDSNPQPKNDESSDEARPAFAIFTFASLRDVCNYVQVLPKVIRVNSSLYLEKGLYYLYIERGSAAYKRYSRACIQALEYSTLYGASPDKLAYLQEHAECLIPEKAVQKLRL